MRWLWLVKVELCLRAFCVSAAGSSDINCLKSALASFTHEIDYFMIPEGTAAVAIAQALLVVTNFGKFDFGYKFNKNSAKIVITWSFLGLSCVRWWYCFHWWICIKPNLLTYASENYTCNVHLRFVLHATVIGRILQADNPDVLRYYVGQRASGRFVNSSSHSWEASMLCTTRLSPL